MSEDERDAIRYRTKRQLDWQTYKMKYDPIADIETSWMLSYDAAIDRVISEAKA